MLQLCAGKIVFQSKVILAKCPMKVADNKDHVVKAAWKDIKTSFQTEWRDIRDVQTQVG